MGLISQRIFFRKKANKSFSAWIDAFCIPDIDMEKYKNEFKQREQILVPLAKQGEKETLKKWINGFGIYNEKFQTSIATAMIVEYQHETPKRKLTVM